MLILFNKPYGVLTQFTDEENRQTLKDYIPVKKVYPAGRLDKDSEGLVVLTDDGKLQNQISHPRHKLEKTYWVQVEGMPTEASLNRLRQGVLLKDGASQPAKVRVIDEPRIWTRQPPIRYRANLPTSWIELTIKEGRNRQVRRMTAAVGIPTLRLIRYSIGNWTIGHLKSGEWTTIAQG
ncbi:MAG: pseudouridine synthase [Gammaproteobacteria bacterium]